MLKNLKIVLKTALLTILILCFAISPVIANSSNVKNVEEFLDDVILSKMDEYNISNLTISIVSNGASVMEKGYGYSNIEKKIPVNPAGTLFRIGSTSKIFTWTAVMQLVEAGMLDLDVDINNYLDFEIPSKLHNEKSETAPITLRHLMTHTPGFEDAFAGLFYLEEDKLPPLNEYLRLHLPARVFPAGEVAAYSNYGSTLAGYIVERVSGVEFAEYIEENIFTPLGMNTSSFRQPLPLELSSKLATPYRFVDGQFLEASFEYVPEPAGAMSTTASDMSKFMMAHLNGGSLNDIQILNADTTKLMHSSQFTHHPLLGGMTLGFMEGIFNGKRTLLQGGGTMIFTTGFYLLPEENVGVFISYSGGGHIISNEIFQAFLDHYYPSSNSTFEKPNQNSLERSRQYRGEYHMSRRSFTTSDSLISLMMGVIQVDVDDDGYLLVTHLGETNSFVEIEPGVYGNLREERTQDYFGPFKTIVFETDPLGRIMITSDGPMTYSKAPWYATGMFTILAFAIVLLTSIASFIYWIVLFILSLFKGKKTQNPKLAVAAGWIAIAFSLVTLLLVTGSLASSEPNPVYGVPMSYFGILPAWASILDIIPMLLAIMAVPIAILSIVAWVKGYWGRFGRIHYSIFATSSIVLIWIFYYWNLV
ncbi:serine hydrolase domain-containing protein [Alkaliphilus peptidifermentans]|uniref:CubicO group peptidase, beta-lactamase class C family n=1 Tax=Alkaliphilus peptidifermentans DSM 18978 TaxID=1120976 RepID=A0A1G5JUD3_9FIRM|nr:serine hydrolase domain-containing protein [Alkaliphilus peptidifermentans]SCY91249.1 CubicO group peptidase, beta-lactamase class C family [Alkaliphilus peptidifermentans DSM 18978]